MMMAVQNEYGKLVTFIAFSVLKFHTSINISRL